MLPLKKILYALMLFLLLCLCFTHVARADTLAAGANTMTVFDDLAHVAAYTLSLVLMGLLTMAVNKLRQKWHIEVPEAWLSKVNGFVDLGIAYAEEQARKAVVKTSVAGNEKLDTALGFVLKFIGDDKQLVALGEAKIKQLIEARLNQARLLEYTSTLPAEPAPVVHTVLGVADSLSAPKHGLALVMSNGDVKRITPSSSPLMTNIDATKESSDWAGARMIDAINEAALTKSEEQP